ncbi:unnamed protein product [Blepharisma stoltei]|uniref:LNR domain-containing protein n=1 Tax=Blepharisma stoltei TaxID=1481888 RepID=A0AAU9J7R3_9CILI|nr:unnamed protein product [Blepharisma stoltei]
MIEDFLCNSYWCPSSSKGDGICDPNCMVSFCNFDSNSTTNPMINPKNSDCYQSCINDYSCLPSNLGNGVCDQNCNNPICGYDLGDCGYCSSDCFQDDLSTGCSDSCDNKNCYFGLGICNDCSPGCSREMLGDGICDKSCNVFSCNYDFGDCTNNQCSPDCELWMIGDNNCNSECNNLSCNWDGGDCDCSQGCHSYMESNGVCNTACDTPACDYDGGDCQKCAPGCLKSMLGDGVCNSACNVSDCHYDNYDCGCADGCSIANYGQCQDSCMNSFCRYDTISSTSQCQNSNQILFALHYGFIFKNLTINVSPDNCTSVTSCLSTEVLDPSSCHTNCKKSSCINSWNMCATNTCADSNCLICNTKSLGDCFKCSISTYQFYGYCLTRCPGGHEAVNLLGNYPACLLPIDYSTNDNPAVYYVTSQNTTDIYGGNGTLINPYTSISLALASIYNKYAIIYLLNDGDYYFICLNTSNPVSTTLVDVCNPLNRSFNLASLLITSYDNSTIMIKTKPEARFPTITITNSTTLTIKNVVFSGKDIFWNCSSETNTYCSYCGNITFKSDGYYSDQGTKVSSYIPQSICNTGHSRTLFNMYLNSKLVLRNVNFTDWRMELKSLITSYGGNITLNNVNFDNIRCYWTVTFTTQPGQNPPPQGKDSVIYFLDCGDPNYNCGSFEYTNGVVSRLNNGYEYGSAQFSGFLSADKIRNVKLKNVTFVNNVVYTPYVVSNTYSLIKLALFRSIEISHCVFDKNIANYGLIYLFPTTLAFRNDVNSHGELIDLLLYHVYIHDTTFKNNFGQYAEILSITYLNQLQRILLENLFINGNGVLSGPLISINNNYYSSQYIADTIITINDTKGNIVDTTFKKRDFIFKNSIITNNYSGGYGIFAITQLFNMRLQNLTVESNGSLDIQNINTILWSYYVADSNLYTNILVSSPANIDCLALWSASSCYNHEISESTFINNICKYNSPSIYYYQVQNANFTDITFERNIGASWYGICIVTQNAGDVRISSSAFNNNTNSLAQGCGALSFIDSLTSVVIEDTIISNNSAGYNPGIYFSDGSLLLNNVTVVSNTASSGLGAIYFSLYTAETHEIKITNSVFKENISLDAKGGAIFISGYILSQDPISLYLKDNLFISNWAPSGSAIYIDSNVVLSNNSIIESCKFMYNTAESKGTITNLFQYGILNISDSLFVANYAELGSALFFSSSEESNPEKSKMILTSCNFTENSGKNVLCTDDMAIYSYIETVKCIFQKNEGLAISLIHDYWKDTESIIANSTMTAGTVYLASNATADCELTSFTNNTSTKYAGAIRAEGSSYFHCSYCNFYQNSAKYGGVLYFDQLSYFNIENSKFSNNFCTDKGAVIYVIGSDEHCVLKSSKLFNNYAESEGLIYSLTSNIKIDNCQIFDNTANRITPGIYLTLSNATITNSQFHDQEGNYGSFIYLASDSWLTVMNSSFKNGKSYASGGSIYALSSSLTLDNTVFENSVSTTGNAILAFSTNLNISQSQFLNTYSSGSGGVINIFGNDILIEKSIFENFTYSAIDGTEIESLTITETSFKNSAGKVGGAISCANTDYVYIDSCNFENNTSLYGGAIYSTFTSNTINSQPYEIISTKFLNNTSSAGGAIFLDNININIKSCEFYNNTAWNILQLIENTHESGIGGAIKLGCSYSGICSFNVFSNNFTGNSAGYEGGAIVWREVMPKFENNLFENNEAKYGENIASYPVSMKIMNLNWDGGLADLASGQLTTTPLVIGLIDHLGSVVTTDYSSVGELISLSQGVVLSGELKVTAISGIFTFSSFVISAEPGSNFAIEIQTNGIDASKSIKANDGINYQSSILVDVALRSCVLGEATVGVNCVVCPKDFYSLNPMNEQCLACPDEAICYGNYTMVPKPGYWRSDMLSIKFWSCPNSKACIGSDPQNISYTGDCKKGYTGNLCQSCSEGYSKIMKNECAKCQNLSIIIIKISGIGLGFLILCWLMVRMSKNSAYKPKSLSSVYIKIFINYIQLIALTTTFSLSWPSYVKHLFSVQNNASFISDQIFSFDCLLYYNEDLKGDESDIFYQKLFVMAILPIFIPFIAAICWSFILLLKKNCALLVDHIVTTSIIVSFLVHPSLIKYYFSSFDCTELDYGKDWLVDDLNLRCWDSQHVFYITAISFPAILLWGIGIPTTCLFLIMKNKDRLNDINIRIKYGFLFNGYKSRSYYWEFVIIYRKIIIICCTVFLATVSVNIQALTTLFVLVACLYFHCKIKPYNGDDLNRLEAISISASAITIYCGMYYLTKSLDQFTELLFFIAIISANSYFVIYWGFKAGNAYLTMIVEKIPYLKKKFHTQNYNIMSDASFREDKTSRIGESSRELILSSIKRENLNPQGVIFKDFNMMKLFLRNLKGNMTINDKNFENIVEKDKIEEKKNIEEGDIQEINIDENSFEVKFVEANHAEESNYEEVSVDEVKIEEEEKIDVDEIVIIDPFLTKAGSSDFSLIVDDL